MGGQIKEGAVPRGWCVWSLACFLAAQQVVLAGGTLERERDARMRGSLLVDLHNATVVPEDRLPYVVSVRRPGSREHVCSGVLLHQAYVLTAAHCVDPDSHYGTGPRPVLHIGAMNAGETEGGNMEVMMAESTTIHESWKQNKLQRSPDNLALVKLPRWSQHPVPKLLTDHFKLDTGHKLMAIGYGPSGSAPALGEDVFGLMKMEPQQYVDGQQCNRTTLWNGSIAGDLACGLNDERKASCVVDSGSPLLLLDTPGYDTTTGSATLDFIVGVNIDGAPCGTSAKPDVYVDLRAQNEWLQNNIKMDREEL